jgi:hypothetical protein
MKHFRKLLLLALAAPLLLLGLFLITNAYDRHRLNQRMDYWTEEMHQALPHGASLPTTQEFFQSRGVSITCRPATDGSKSCTGREDKEYGVLPTWHIRFNLTFSGNALVGAERVALGVGL